MHYEFFRPNTQSGQHRAEFWDDLDTKLSAEVVASELSQPSAELVREQGYTAAAQAELGIIHEQIRYEDSLHNYATAALAGIYRNLRPGLHRRHESFGEVIRDEISSRFKHALGRVAAVGSAIRKGMANTAEYLSSYEPAQYLDANLNDFGFLAPAGHRRVGEPKTTRVPELEEVESYFSDDDLAEIRSAVAASHRAQYGTVYRSSSAQQQ